MTLGVLCYNIIQQPRLSVASQGEQLTRCVRAAWLFGDVHEKCAVLPFGCVLSCGHLCGCTAPAPPLRKHGLVQARRPRLIFFLLLIPTFCLQLLFVLM